MLYVFTLHYYFDDLFQENLVVLCWKCTNSICDQFYHVVGLIYVLYYCTLPLHYQYR